MLLVYSSVFYTVASTAKDGDLRLSEYYYMCIILKYFEVIEVCCEYFFIIIECPLRVKRCMDKKKRSFRIGKRSPSGYLIFLFFRWSEVVKILVFIFRSIFL